MIFFGIKFHFRSMLSISYPENWDRSNGSQETMAIFQSPLEIFLLKLSNIWTPSPSTKLLRSCGQYGNATEYMGRRAK